MKTYYQRNKKRIIARVTKWKKENPEKVSLYTKKCNNSEKAKIRVKEWNKNNWEKYLDGKRKWKDKNPELYKKIQTEWRIKNYKENKKPRLARNMAERKIKLNLNCEICNSNEKLERHHWNYEKPLLVNTLCNTCHDIQHIKHFDMSEFAGGIENR
jgi:hypothetical protein